ncbi:MAG: bifunctional folylpolyglutamate synthase/dihydrofolate synthase [Tissierellia bacterium]|nr:bifunctional folylpolyglutamate synthase/dihydrofolate synthase [Tissierellia bacterium]
MDIKEAVDYVYKSYMIVKDDLDWGMKDSEKRNPEYSRPLLLDSDFENTILVTGSKGKGSVTNMVSCILGQKYTVGTMTSPHIINFNERIKVNGEEISDLDFSNIMEELKPLIDKIQSNLRPGEYISPMGIQAAVAMRYFKYKNVDVSVYECGKGVKYDDANNIKHAYAVINPIFNEHMRELGDTVVDIAKDKVHIIDGNKKYVYVADQKAEVYSVIEERAGQYGVELKRYGKDFSCDKIRYTSSGMVFDVDIGGDLYKDVKIPLLGDHQAKNFALAMSLSKDYMGLLPDLRNVLDGLEYHGRMEIINSKPLVILDASIHAENADYVKKTLSHLGLSKVNVIIGIPDDKDYLGVAKTIADLADEIILTRSSNKHYYFSDRQKEVLANNGISAIATSNFIDAFSIAKKNNNPIIILGTTSLISDVISNRDNLGLGIFA